MWMRVCALLSEIKISLNYFSICFFFHWLSFFLSFIWKWNFIVCMWMITRYDIIQPSPTVSIYTYYIFFLLLFFYYNAQTYESNLLNSTFFHSLYFFSHLQLLKKNFFLLRHRTHTNTLQLPHCRIDERHTLEQMMLVCAHFSRYDFCVIALQMVLQYVFVRMSVCVYVTVYLEAMRGKEKKTTKERTYVRTRE